MNTDQINHQTVNPLFIDDNGTMIDLTNVLLIKHCNSNLCSSLYEVTVANGYNMTQLPIRVSSDRYQLLVSKFNNVVDRRLSDNGDLF